MYQSRSRVGDVRCFPYYSVWQLPHADLDGRGLRHGTIVPFTAGNPKSLIISLIIYLFISLYQYPYPNRVSRCVLGGAVNQGLHAPLILVSNILISILPCG